MALSSFREPEIDARQWGYRVVVPTATTTARNYTTTSSIYSSLSMSSHGEDYDEYTLHNAPSEGTHCNLGIIPGAVPPSPQDALEEDFVDVEAVLEFDDAGMVKPVWETAMSPEEAAWNNDYENYHNETDGMDVNGI